MGCPRSGTSALRTLLSSHDQVCIGAERFGSLALTGDFINEAHFAPSRFFDVQPKDTHWDYVFRDIQPNRYRKATYVGDKVPYFFRRLEKLDQNFPGAKKIAIVRDILEVASSYLARLQSPSDSWILGVEAAVTDWNDSLKAILDNQQSETLLILSYHRLFNRGTGLNHALRFLGLDSAPHMEETYQSMVGEARKLRSGRRSRLNPEDKRYIRANADFRSYREVLRRARNMEKPKFHS
jgi:hypothetical protein